MWKCQAGSYALWNPLKINLGTSYLSDVFIYAANTRKISMLMKFVDEDLEAPIVQKMIMVLCGKDWIISKTELIGTKLIALI